MRFEISFKQDEKTWQVRAIEGSFAGQVVAHAEGLTLEDVNFMNHTLIGSINSAWGIVLNDEVTTSRTMLRALGVGQVFMSKASTPFFTDRSAFFCAETNRPMTNAAHVMVLGRGMFYNLARRKARA
ncbi:hypothetical protein [Ferribacterium limneticum]|uniref:hypothetical protein n=1 Tax=Ferribacterium limneticum TaxID=76259 RepID=UPI001CF8D734|nr:hypothetical protein [Ferribacterium limneticum]UCV26730.1 hypothetical protein KI617_10455 [Ferribacterium limneticum]UCV30647.1 hypothetical protein KI608_10455 [Ferribacterium limneticum]